MPHIPQRFDRNVPKYHSPPSCSICTRFFRPSPHFLVAATARQISHWALLSNKNYIELREAFLVWTAS